MNMKKIKAISVLLVLVLCTAVMGACSSGTLNHNKGEKQIVPDSYEVTGETARYNGESLNMPVAGITLKRAVSSQNGVFMYGNDDSGKVHFFELDRDSLEISELGGFGGEEPECIAASSDGALHVLRTDEEGNYVIASALPDGEQTVVSIDPDIYEEDIIYEFYAADEAFFLNLSDHIAAIGRDGSLAYDYGIYTGGETVVRLKDKTLLIKFGSGQNVPQQNQSSGTTITELGGLGPGQSYHVEPMFVSFFAGAENQLLGWMNGVIYAYDYNSGRSEAVLGTYASGIRTQTLVCLKDKEFFSINDGQPYIWRQSASEGTTVLTLATYNISYGLNSAIQAFNASNSDYMIKPIDYAVYDTYSAADSGYTKYVADIVSGNAPDMYDLSRVFPNSYAAKGLLEDLKPYFENDAELSYDSLMPCVRDNAEFDGGLYELIPAFSLVTVCADASTAGEAWGVERFIALTREYPPEMLFGPELTKSGFLSDVLCFMKDELYSEETLQCNFVSESFASMLEFAASLPDSVELEGNQGEPHGRAYAGEQLLACDFFGDFIVDEISLYNTAFGGEAQFVGFPTEQGSGFGIAPADRIGMSSSSANKAGVWEFFCFLLSDGIQANSRMFKGLPVVTAAYEKVLERQIGYAVEQPPRCSALSTTGVIEFSGTDVEPDAMRAQVNSMLEKADCIYSCDSSILDIVMSCAQTYFEGDRPVSDVMQDIQSKVGIYLSEQYG